MWYATDFSTRTIKAFVDLLQGELPDDRFHSGIEAHPVNGEMVVAVAFQYLDCNRHHGPIAVHLISEPMMARATACAEIRGGLTPENAAAQLMGVIESEEADDPQEVFPNED